MPHFNVSGRGRRTGWQREVRLFAAMGNTGSRISGVVRSRDELLFEGNHRRTNYQGVNRVLPQRRASYEALTLIQETPDQPIYYSKQPAAKEPADTRGISRL